MHHHKQEKIEEHIVLEGRAVVVAYTEQSVHIRNDAVLEQLLAVETETVTDQLVAALKSRFRDLYGRELDITDNSLAVEIWGHLYTGQLAEALEELLPLLPVTAITTKVLEYCEVIDCGISGHDSNRALWDLLAPFKSGIAGWLPGKTGSETPE